METVHRQLKLAAHLNLINQNKIILCRIVLFLNIIVERMVFLQCFILGQIKINVNDIRIAILLQNIRLKPLHQL